MNLKGLKINFLGDSITEGVGTSGDGFRFVDRIAQETGAVCRNYGISGTRLARQRVASWDLSFDKYFGSRVEEMDKDADVVVIFGGTNDYGHGDAPVGDFCDRTVDTFCGAVHCLYRSIIEKYPASKIVVITPLHRVGELDPRVTGPKGEEPVCLVDFVDIIREIAEYYSLPVLDLFATSGLQPEVGIIQDMYIPDGLHPNDAGHVILANKIKSFLEQLV